MSIRKILSLLTPLAVVACLPLIFSTPFGVRAFESYLHKKYSYKASLGKLSLRWFGKQRAQNISLFDPTAHLTYHIDQASYKSKQLNLSNLRVFSENFHTSGFDVLMDIDQNQKAVFSFSSFEVEIENAKGLQSLIGLLKKKPVGKKSFHLDVAGSDVEYTGNTLHFSKTKIVLDHSIKVFIQGDYDMTTSKVDLLLTFPKKSIKKLLGIKSPFAFAIPIQGRIDQITGDAVQQKIIGELFKEGSISY